MRKREERRFLFGHDKPWKKETMAIVQMATESFLWLIKSKYIPI